MNLPFHIARRYLFAKKSTNAVNWITGISSIGVMVGTAAMVIVLAAFAGLDNLVRSFYTTFDPDIKIIPAEGKFKQWTESDSLTLASFDEVVTSSKIIEDKALFRFRDREYIAQIKGVEENYNQVSDIESALYKGTFIPPNAESPTAVLGSGVAAYLGISSLQSVSSFNVYVPKTGSFNRLNPMGNVSFKSLYPVGIFEIQPELDSKYVFTNINFARSLFGTDSAISGVELKLQPDSDLGDFKEDLQSALGSEWQVLDRDDLQVAIFKVLKSEGLITYLVLTFILLVASFGILSSVNILILEKKKDLLTLWSMGASEKLLRRIFMAEGLLVSLGGGLIGLAIGVIVVVLQDQYGLVSMGNGYLVDYYPVELRFSDLLQVLITILAVGFSISWLAVRKLKVNALN